MKLSDARRVAIRGQLSLRFALSSGLECVVDRHGIARVPGIAGPTALNIEDEFAAAQRFVVQTEGGAPREIPRAALEELAQARQLATQAPDHGE
jgi:hypothetical protein